MKLLILSDIHSNIYALNAIWEQEGGADVILCAGDLVDYGTTPREVIAWVQDKQVRCVMGNHDRHLVNTYEQGDYNRLAPGQFKWVHHNCQKLGDAEVDFLRRLPLVLDVCYDGIRYTVSHMYRDYEVVETLDAMEQYLRAKGLPPSDPQQQHRLVFGHRHRRAVCYLADNRLWLNPGSVSYRRPDDPDKSAHYIVVTDGVLSLRSAPYDRTLLLAEAERYIATNSMMTTELQDARFFFGDAKTTRDDL